MNKRDIKKYYFTGSALGALGTTFFMPILYAYLEKKGYSLTELGFYMSMFWFITFIFEIPTGILADSLGQRRSVMVSGFLRGFGLLILLLNKNYAILLLSGILTGLAEALSSGSLSSWAVNSLKKVDKNENLQKLFSISGNINAIIGLVLGYLTSKFIYNYNIDLPILLSGLTFIIVGAYFLLYFPKEGKNIKDYDYNLVAREVKETTVSTVKFLKNNKSILLTFIVLILPAIIDVGPSNQWQLAFKEKKISIANLWVILSLIGIFANSLLANLPKTKNFKREFLIILILDILFIFGMIYTNYILIFFMLHVFTVNVLEMKVGVYLHEEVITDDSLRSTMFSSFNTVHSLFISALLPISGKLSDKYSIFTSWKITISVSTIVIFIGFILFNVLNGKSKLTSKNLD